MPDRRQGDRRESHGIQNKQLKISLQTFITIVVIIAAIIVSTIVCIFVSKKSYDEGYEKGYTDGIVSDYMVDDYDNVNQNIDKILGNVENVENNIAE